MEFKKWQNCLRVQIAPDKDQDVKIDKLVEHCKKYGFTDVMAMINAEELCVGHMTIAEAKNWVEMFKKERVKLIENGITFSINTWIEMGHNDRGWKLKNGQNYHTIVDYEGNESKFIACALDKNFRKDFLDYVYYLVSELTPDVYWVEDDYRYHNHPPIKFPCCFCDLHMAEYNKRLNANYTREEFASKVMEKGGLNKERKVFLDVERDSLTDFAREIGETVKKACKTTKVGLMSSQPGAHALEGRDWDKMFSALAQGSEKINRIHLAYGEPSGKEWLYEMNRNAMAVRAFTPKDAVVMPEYENGEPTAFGVSPRFMEFKLQSSAALSLKGMTYSIYGFTGNGVTDEFGYGDAVKNVTPYLQGVEDLGIDYYSLDGVIVPVDPMASYKREIRTSFWDLNPKDYTPAANLSIMGISYAYSTKKSFKDKVVALFGTVTFNFTDEELINLFKDNTVIVDGGAALELENRNLLYLIGAKKCEIHPFDTGYQLYEAVTDGEEIFGLKRFRASCRWSVGDYVKIDYDKPVKILTETYNETGEKRAPAMVEYGNALVIPYYASEKTTGLATAMRREMLANFLDRTGKIARTEKQAVSPYLYREKDRTVLMVINSTVDNFENIKVKLPKVCFKTAKYVAKDGELKPVEYKTDGDYVVFMKKFEYLSAETIVLE